jgi:hypothetical protein
MLTCFAEESAILHVSTRAMPKEGDGGEPGKPRGEVVASGYPTRVFERIEM